MLDILKELDEAITTLDRAGFSDADGKALTNTNEWHTTYRLVKQLRTRVALLDANPAMSHGLRPAPAGAKLSN